MKAEKKFEQTFGAEPDATARAPARVNLIGEHTDYNGGLVLPMPMPIFTEAAIALNAAGEDEIVSSRFDEKASLPLYARASGHWSDYASGALQKAREVGLLSGGARVAIASDVPDGAGISSSAALIIAILRAAAELGHKQLDDTDIAKIAQAVEHDHIGVPCGIMDQMAIAAGKSRHAMRLDTESLDYTLIPLPENWRIVVIHSGVHRKLDDGRYAMRREECEQAAMLLGVDKLCKLPRSQFNKIDSLPEPLDRRARHVVRDHARVDEVVRAIKEKDLAAFEAVLNAGHASLRDDFEVSTPEIDQLVEIACEEGASGARLTGGGFGGCIVACIDAALEQKFLENTTRRFPLGQLIC